MNVQPVALPRDEASASDEPLVRAGWRRFLTTLVALITVGSFILMLLALPYFFASHQLPCLGEACGDERTLLPPASAAALAGYGVSLQAYAAYQSVVAFAIYALGAAMSLLILWQRPGSRIALLVALALGTGASAANMLHSLIAVYPAAAPLILMVQYISTVSIILVFFVFPDGRFVPSWLRWWAAIFLINEFIIVFWGAAAFRPNPALGFAQGAIWLLTYVVVVAVQLYRFRTVSGPIARTQTKWVVFGLAASITVSLLLIAGAWLLGAMSSPAYNLLFAVVTPLLFGLLPLTLGIAILRYRLFDIDLIIRRTLVYTALTALLVGLYFGSIVLLQGVFVTVSGQRSPISLVISTLLIAALFAPLRRRIQRLIDRRFFRPKYDAQQVLERFAVAARDETDLEKLTAELETAIIETMHPDKVAIWLGVSTES
jgi:hypothetical protein